MIIQILIIIVGFLFMNLSSAEGLESISFCIDIPTLLCILVFTLPVLLRRGMWQDFMRAFRMLKRTYVCSLGDLKRTKEAVELMQKQVMYGGVIVMIMGIIYLLAMVNNPASVGPALAVAVLSILYTAVLELLLLPLQHEVGRRIIDYMEGED